MWPFKSKPRTQTIINEAPRFVMTTFRDRLIVADNKEGNLKELSLDHDGMYIIQEIVKFR